MTFITTLYLQLLLATPIVTLSQGIVESNLNIYATGDSGKSHGAFQIQKRYWGATPDTFLGQAQHCEKVRSSLSRDIWAAVEKYNGQGDKAADYRWKVQKTAIRLALL